MCNRKVCSRAAKAVDLTAIVDAVFKANYFCFSAGLSAHPTKDQVELASRG